MAFISLGPDVEAVGSFNAMCIPASPASANTVGHGVAGAQGGGVVTFVITSELRVAVTVPPVLARPRIPPSESMTRYDGDRPVRTTSPHEAAAPIKAPIVRNRVML